jgi:hypothetical protein
MMPSVIHGVGSRGAWSGKRRLMEWEDGVGIDVVVDRGGTAGDKSLCTYTNM